MALIPQHNEGASLVLAAAFTALDGTATTPASARYRVDCATTGVNVVPWTSLTPAQSVNIHITAAQNAILSASSDFEKRLVTLEWTSGDYTGVAEYGYALKNLRGIT